MAAGSARGPLTIDFPMHEIQSALDAIRPDFSQRPFAVVFERAQMRALREAQARVLVGSSVSKSTQKLVRGGSLKSALTARRELRPDVAEVIVGVMGPEAASHPYAAITELGGNVPVRRPVRKRWMRYVAYDQAAIASAKTTKKGSRKKIPIVGTVFAKVVKGFYRVAQPYLMPALQLAGEEALKDLKATLDARWRKKRE